MYESDEVEKAMTQTFEFTTLQSNYTDSAGKVTRVMYQSDEVEKAVTQTFEFTTLKSNYTDYVDEAGKVTRAMGRSRKFCWGWRGPDNIFSSPG